jgi:hypothetical protein
LGRSGFVWGGSQPKEADFGFAGDIESLGWRAASDFIAHAR